MSEPRRCALFTALTNAARLLQTWRRVISTAAFARTTIMETRIENGFLIVKVPLQTPTPSKTGKRLLVASTHGSKMTGERINGKPVFVNVNADIGPAEAPKGAGNE